MSTHLNAAHRRHEVTNNNTNSFIDVLAVLLTGGIGMFLALLGVYLDNLGFLIAGWIIIAISIAVGLTNLGKSFIEFMSSYRNYKAERKNKNQ